MRVRLTSGKVRDRSLYTSNQENHRGLSVVELQTAKLRI